MASNSETSIERTIRLVLEGLGIYFTAQAGIGPWVVDFMAGNLVIEADGSYWHSLRPSVDKRKTADLAERGFAVWRIEEAEIKSAGFARAFAGRLADYEVAFGDLPRLNPPKPFTPDENPVIGGQP